MQYARDKFESETFKQLIVDSTASYACCMLGDKNKTSPGGLAAMGKLVRDKIPQIIMSDGKNPIIRTLSDEEFLTELDKKLDEEIAEYQADKSLEEMADVLEVLFTICEARGYSIDELMKVRDEKRENRGGFKEKIFWAGNE